MKDKIYFFDALIFGCGVLAGETLATGIYFENALIAIGGIIISAGIGGVCMHIKHKFS